MATENPRGGASRFLSTERYKVAIAGCRGYVSRFAGHLSEDGRFTVAQVDLSAEPEGSRALDTAACVCICAEHPREVLLLLETPALKNRRKAKVIYCPESNSAAVKAAAAQGAQMWLTDLSGPRAVGTMVETAIVCSEIKRELEARIQELSETLETQKLIARAKGLIMQWLQVGEEAAYKIVQKAARDKNIRMSEVAKQILLVKDLLQPRGGGNKSLEGQTAVLQEMIAGLQPRARRSPC